MNVAAVSQVERAHIPDFNTRRFAWLKGVMADGELKSPIAKVLASVLITQFANAESGDCFPGNDVLAESLGGVSHDTIQRAFKALAARGWLQRTEGRGRGNFSVVVFHFRAEVVKLHPREKTGQNVHARTPEKAADLRFQVKEKAANLQAKGRKSAASRIEPNLNQKERVRELPRQEPVYQLKAVAHYGSYREADWNTWLTKHGYLTLDKIGHLDSDAVGRGYAVPFSRPPQPDNALETRIALEWADRAIELFGVRQ